MDHRIGLTRKDALDLARGQDPWKTVRKVAVGSIVHEIEIEIDGAPSAVVVFKNGKCGTDDLYDLGVTRVDESGYHDSIKKLGTPSLDVAIAKCEKLAANAEAVARLFV